MSKIALIWFMVSMVFYFVGTYLSKLYSDLPTYFLFISSMIFFTIVSIFWMFLLKETNQLAVIGSIWSIVCLIIQVFIGVFLFKESLSATKWIGIGIGTISVILLSF